MIDLSIIIVGTNEKENVFKCLSSVYRSKITYSFETIFVDNCSTDGTLEMVGINFDNVIIKHNIKKFGYIYNNNQAMEIAKGKYFLIINADIVLEENTLEVMVAFMNNHPDAGVSSCKLVFPDGSLQHSCRRFPTPLIYLSRMSHFFQWMTSSKGHGMNIVAQRYLMIDYDHKETKDVDWFISAFFLMRKSVVRELGNLDEKLFPPFYLEDVEWCFRTRLKGWKAYYVPKVYATHYYFQSSVKKFGILSIVHMLNVLYFFKKHGLSMLLRKHRRNKI